MKNSKTRRTVLRMSVTALLLAAVALVAGGLISPAAAVEGSGRGVRGPAKTTSQPTELPEEILSEVLELLYQREHGDYLRALDPEAFRKAAKEWEKQVGLPVKIKAYSPFFDSNLTYLNQRRYVTLANGASVWVKQPRDSTAEFAVVLVDSRGSKAVYAIANESFAKRDFAYVGDVTIIDPVNVRLEDFSTRGESLLDLTMRLCKLGKLDYSIPEDLLDRAKVTLKLRNKSIADCLKVAARAAGFRVYFEGPRTYSSRQPESEYRSFVHDWSLMGGGKNVRVRQKWEKARTEAVAKGKKPPTPLEVIESIVLEGGRDVLRNRPLVILEPVKPE